MHPDHKAFELPADPAAMPKSGQPTKVWIIARLFAAVGTAPFLGTDGMAIFLVALRSNICP